MSYTYPAPYKCIKCAHEFEYTPDRMHPAPVLYKAVDTDRGTYQQSMPVCPSCWATFLMKNLGLGYGTTNWNGTSDYDKEKNETSI